jgi:hypothetical protein
MSESCILNADNESALGSAVDDRSEDVDFDRPSPLLSLLSQYGCSRAAAVFVGLDNCVGESDFFLPLADPRGRPGLFLGRTLDDSLLWLAAVVLWLAAAVLWLLAAAGLVAAAVVVVEEEEELEAEDERGSWGDCREESKG